MDDITIIEEFVDRSVQQQEILLATPKLRAETIGGANQLLSKTEGIIATTHLNSDPRNVLVKWKSSYWKSINQLMLGKNFIPVTRHKDVFYNYQYRPTPKGYELRCASAIELWRDWWRHRSRSQGLGIPMEMLVWTRESWYPIRDVICSNGSLYIKALGNELAIYGSDILIWLEKVEQSAAEQPSNEPQTFASDSARYNATLRRRFNLRG